VQGRSLAYKYEYNRGMKRGEIRGKTGEKHRGGTTRRSKQKNQEGEIRERRRT